MSNQRSRPRSIPSEFVRLDTRTNAADSFANVRDLHVERENHNILLARGTKAPLASVVTTANDQGGGPATFYSSRAVSSTSVEIIIQAPIFIGHSAQHIEFSMRASETSALGSSPIVYASIQDRLNPPDVELAKSFTVTGTSEATYQDDLPIPQSLRGKGGVGYLVMGLICHEQGSDPHGPPVAISYATETVIGATLGGDRTNYMIYFSDGSIQPRRIVSSYLDGSTYYVTMDRPLNKLPQVGTDTAYVRLLTGLNLYNYTLRERAVSDFGATVS